VAADTPAREATSARVGSFGADSAGSLVVDAAISGSLKSPGANHSEPNNTKTSDMPTETIHLRPTTTLAERVLLPGDPGRALALAQFLLESPLMFNHHRGLWGYTGMAKDGEPLTIQSTGMGGPSAAIVLHELISLGVTRAIRVGTCGALDPTLGLGDLVVANESIAADGTSAALGAGALARADAALSGALRDALERRGSEASEKAEAEADTTSGTQPTDAHGWRQGRIVSTDLFYECDSRRNESWSAEGAIAVEMEASTLFAVGASAGIQVACLLAVSDTFDGPDARTRIDDDALLSAAEAMGSVAVAALA
jgi:uridine phosphorylase